MSDSPTSAKAVPGRALVPFVPAAQTAPEGPTMRFTLRHGAWAVGLTVAFGIGAFAADAARTALSRPDPMVVQAEVTARVMKQLEGEVARLKGSVDTLRVAADGARQDDSLRTIRKSVESLRAEIDQVRTADGTSLAQIAGKIDKADHDPNPKLADIAARLDRIEHEPAARSADTQGPRVADLTSRLDRLEKQVSPPAVTGSIAPPAAPHAAPTVTAVPRVPLPSAARSDAGALADGRPRPPIVGAWVVREVYDGMALVEARGGGLREIGPGEYLPGAGQVRSIERRGRDWIVLTSRGVIEPNAF